MSLVKVIEHTNVEIECDCKQQIPSWEDTAWSVVFKAQERTIAEWEKEEHKSHSLLTKILKKDPIDAVQYPTGPNVQYYINSLRPHPGMTTYV